MNESISPPFPCRVALDRFEGVTAPAAARLCTFRPPLREHAGARLTGGLARRARRLAAE